MEKRYIFVWALTVVVVFAMLGCESSTTEPSRDESNWVQLGWEALIKVRTAQDSNEANLYLEEARADFGNAKKIDPTYAPAYTGEGWTSIYEHDMGGAMDSFQDGFLFGGDLPDTDSHKRMLYIGAMVALHGSDDYNDSITYGLTYYAMDPNHDFVFVHDSTFSAFDAIMYLVLDYFVLGDETNVEIYIDALIDIINGADWTFTDWEDCAAKINELAGLDPS